ncbi:uncharacterized protein C10orf67 homolog, mitochondrial isoform X7 [Chelonia mydas]|uniref:uncharacterized protein C10orf67 homolog, mitochondrial isoform X7 n=1 Tax=Chelonia mydas TaxID=8469 RepID=UPI001CA8223D|nr:uncharacterized protein C10orf67 homolog, mitochondrial isoform X7 [Chelonia mydas]
MSSISAGRKLSLSPHILELLALPCCLEELEADCRPSISDDLKVGYFITDHATQTDIKEIVELKELTTTTQALVQKEVKIRQSYQQQLCDALAVLRVDYEIIFGSDDDNEKKILKKENEDFRREVSKLLDRISHLEESLERSEKENNKLDKEVRGMQLKMEKDEKTVQKLIEAQEKIKMELEKERSLNQSMLKEQKDTETKVEKKLTEPQKKIPSLQEKDTKKMKEKVKSGSEITVPHESRESQKGYHKQQQKKSPSYKEAEKRALLAEIEKLKILEGQEKQRIQRYRPEFLRHSFNSINILTVCGVFYFSLKNEVEQINRSWAKKFQILKKSLHAIKDEMFLRHALYRQAASFNQASLNQTLAVPLYIETGASQINERRGALYLPFSPLPQIPSQSTAEMEETDLNIVKIPTGTEMCSLYEDANIPMPPKLCSVNQASVLIFEE